LQFQSLDAPLPWMPGAVAPFSPALHATALIARSRISHVTISLIGCALRGVTRGGARGA